jgi:uncharacterized protein YwgA
LKIQNGGFIQNVRKCVLYFRRALQVKPLKINFTFYIFLEIYYGGKEITLSSEKIQNGGFIQKVNTQHNISSFLIIKDFLNKHI